MPDENPNELQDLRRDVESLREELRALTSVLRGLAVPPVAGSETPLAPVPSASAVSPLAGETAPTPSAALAPAVMADIAPATSPEVVRSAPEVPPLPTPPLTVAAAIVAPPPIPDWASIAAKAEPASLPAVEKSAAADSLPSAPAAAAPGATPPPISSSGAPLPSDLVGSNLPPPATPVPALPSEATAVGAPVEPASPTGPPPASLGFTPPPTGSSGAAIPPPRVPPTPPPRTVPPAPNMSGALPPSPSAPKRSLEMIIGRYWIPALGAIFIVLTVVLGASAAWQFLPELGPGMKLAGLYLASGVVAATGGWLAIRGAPQIQNYGKVVLGAGLAAVWYCTYAAHHVQALRVVESEGLDVLLLLLVGGGIVFLAERLHSQTMAVFAIGLSFFACASGRTDGSLVGALVITAVSIFLLLRNRWLTLTFVTLLGTYASYAFWFYAPVMFEDGETASGGFSLWARVGVLFLYWLTHTTAVFFSRAEHFGPAKKLIFLTLNNVAYATLLLWSVQLATDPPSPWPLHSWTIAVGLLFVGAAVVALVVNGRAPPPLPAGVNAAESDRAFFFAPLGPLVRGGYLAQGLALVVAGLLGQFTGVTMVAIMLALALTLWATGYLAKSVVSRVFGHIVAGVAAIGACAESEAGHGGLALILITFGVMMAGAWWARRSWDKGDDLSRWSWEAMWPTLLACLMVLVICGRFVPTDYQLSAILLFAIAAAATTRVLPLPEWAFLGQGFTAIALILLFDKPEFSHSGNAFLLMATSMGLGIWWEYAPPIPRRPGLAVTVQAGLALVLLGAIFWWIQARFATRDHLVVLPLLSLPLLVYGLYARQYLVAAAGQLMLLGCAFVLAFYIPGWPFTQLQILTPLAMLVIYATLLPRFLRAAAAQHAAGNDGIIAAPELRLFIPRISPAWVGDGLTFTSWIYTGFATIIWWRWLTPPPPVPGFLLCALVAFGSTLWFCKTGRQTLYFIALAHVFYGFILLLVNDSVPAYRDASLFPGLLLDLAAFALIAGQSAIPGFFPPATPASPEWRTIWNAIAITGILLQTTFLLYVHDAHAYVTIVWAGLAALLFAVALLLRERAFRYATLGVLAMAVIRFLGYDLFQIGSPGWRFLATLAVTVTLIGIGAVYNRWGKGWL